MELLVVNILEDLQITNNLMVHIKNIYIKQINFSMYPTQSCLLGFFLDNVML
jgi:hypothetical protein